MGIQNYSFRMAEGRDRQGVARTIASHSPARAMHPDVLQNAVVIEADQRHVGIALFHWADQISGRAEILHLFIEGGADPWFISERLTGWLANHPSVGAQANAARPYKAHPAAVDSLTRERMAEAELDSEFEQIKNRMRAVLLESWSVTG